MFLVKNLPKENLRDKSILSMFACKHLTCCFGNENFYYMKCHIYFTPHLFKYLIYSMKQMYTNRWAADFKGGNITITII